jgi:phosphomannomutase / phosphoglucomutase
MPVPASIFREYDVRGVVGTEIEPDTAAAIGRAYAVLLADRGVRGPILVGRDNRPSGTALRDALVEALVASGVSVIDVGVLPTPAMYWSLRDPALVPGGLPAGGIQITASHNPPEYNGFKICVGTHALAGDAIQELLRINQSGRTVAGPRGSVSHAAPLDRYVDDMATRLGRVQRPIRVILDGANGAGAGAMTALLDRMGVDYRCLFCESDGTFPNHLPDPSVAANLAALSAAVRDSQASSAPAAFGVAIDGGSMVWGDRVLVLFARDILPRHPGARVIFDVKCTDALGEAITKAGGVPTMSQTGHSLIEARMNETGAPLAGELSGHMYIADGWHGFDDGIYSAGRLIAIVAAAGASLGTLLADVPEYPSTPEIRVACPDDRKFVVVADAVAHFALAHPVETVDGARIGFGDGWALVRASNTQPALSMRFEARSAARLAEIRREVEQWLRGKGVVL